MRNQNVTDHADATCKHARNQAGFQTVRFVIMPSFGKGSSAAAVGVVGVMPAMEANSTSHRASAAEKPWMRANVQQLLEQCRASKQAVKRTKLSRQIRKLIRIHRRQNLNCKMTSASLHFRISYMYMTNTHSRLRDPERYRKLILVQACLPFLQLKTK